MKKLLSILLLMALLLSGCSTKASVEKLEFDKELTDFVYSHIELNKDGLLIATRDGNNYILDLYGNETSDSELLERNAYSTYHGTYKGIHYYSDGNRDDQRLKLMDEYGNSLPEINIPEGWRLYNSEDYYNEDSIVPAIDFNNSSSSMRMVGYINKYSGDVVIDAKFWEAGSFENGIALVRLPSEGHFSSYAYIDKVGNQIEPMITGYYEQQYSHRDFWNVSYSVPALSHTRNYQNGIIPNVYSISKSYHGEGILAAMETTTTRYIFKDINGNVIHHEPFLRTTGFSDGTAFVHYPSNSFWHIISLDGRISQTEYRYIDWQGVTYDKDLGYYFLQKNRDDKEGIYVDRNGIQATGNEINKLKIYKEVKDRNNIELWKKVDLDYLISTFDVESLIGAINENNTSINDKSISAKIGNQFYYADFTIGKSTTINPSAESLEETRQIYASSVDSEYIYTNIGVYDWEGNKVYDGSDSIVHYNGRSYTRVHISDKERYGLGYLNEDGSYTIYNCETARNIGNGLLIVGRREEALGADGKKTEELRYALVSLNPNIEKDLAGLSKDLQAEKETVVVETIVDEVSEEVSHLDNGDYLLPYSNTRYLDEGDIYSFTPLQLTLARNEIYARHGRPFINEEIKDYFSTKSWYQPLESFDDDYYWDNVFNEYEKSNVELIKSMEDSL